MDLVTLGAFILSIASLVFAIWSRHNIKNKIKHDKKIDSLNAIQKYVKESKIHDYNRGDDLLSIYMQDLLKNEFKFDDYSFGIVLNFFLRMSKEWKRGIIVSMDIENEFWEYIQGLNNKVGIDVFFCKPEYFMLKTMFKKVKQYHVDTFDHA